MYLKITYHCAGQTLTMLDVKLGVIFTKPKYLRLITFTTADTNMYFLNLNLFKIFSPTLHIHVNKLSFHFSLQRRMNIDKDDASPAGTTTLYQH